MKNIILSIISIIFTFLIVFNYNKINICIIESCNLFLHKIFPSLFCMLLISNILIELNLIKYINIPFKYINNKIFKINENTSYILLVSILSGTPSNTVLADTLYNNKLITKSDIQKIILFSHFINPFFIINNIKYKPLLVLCSHYLSNIIIGILFRNKYINNYSINIKSNNKTLFNIIFDSIDKIIHTSLFILGTIITFNIISTTLNSSIISSILEFSTAVNYINGLNISNKMNSIICGMLLSFGGLCIHMQVYGILNKIHIKYIPYLISRLLHSLITGLIIFLLY